MGRHPVRHGPQRRNLPDPARRGGEVEHGASRGLRTCHSARPSRLDMSCRGPDLEDENGVMSVGSGRPVRPGPDERRRGESNSCGSDPRAWGRCLVDPGRDSRCAVLCEHAAPRQTLASLVGRPSPSRPGRLPGVRGLFHAAGPGPQPSAPARRGVEGGSRPPRVHWLDRDPPAFGPSAQGRPAPARARTINTSGRGVQP